MWDLKVGNSLEVLAAMATASVDCVVTSPPYWNLRDYHGEGGWWPVVSYTPYPGGSPITIPAQDAQLGAEPDPDAYIGHLVLIFREVFRVLHDEGTFFLNIGDTYLKKTLKGLPAKTLFGIPWRVCMALQSEGWILRNDIIWHKTRVLPSGAKDRFTTDHEYVFFFSKSPKYFFDRVGVREPCLSSDFAKRRMKSGQERQAGGSVQANNEAKSAINAGSNLFTKYSVGDPDKGRNRRTVWSLCTSNFGGKHFATFPKQLVSPCIKAGTSVKGRCPVCGTQWVRVGDTEEFESGCGHQDEPTPSVVLDPFAGAATTLLVADEMGRDSIGVEISEEFAVIARTRLAEHSRSSYAPWQEEYVPEDPEAEIDEMALDELFSLEQ